MRLVWPEPVLHSDVCPPTCESADMSEQPDGGASSDVFSRSRMAPAKFNELISLIYEGPLETLPWASSLNFLRDLLGANWVTLILRPASERNDALIINAGPKGPFMEQGKFSSRTAFTLDPFVGLPADKVLTVEEMIGAGDWHTSDFYKQFVEPYDIRYLLGFDIYTKDGSECRFRVCRSHASQPFSDRDRAACEALLPHLKRSIELHSRLDHIESERRLYAGAVDRMMLGTVVFDETGTIMKTNKVADEILRAHDGIHLSNGTLEAKYSAENRSLQQFIRTALENATNLPQAMSITRPSGLAKYGVAIRSVPLSEWSEGRHRPAVMVFLRDPEHKSQASPDVIQSLFELTPAEAALALLLADGMTLEEAADDLNIRKNTARAHLRSIFSKTGVTRQTALVRLLLGSITPNND